MRLIKWFERHNKLSWIITIIIAMIIFYFSTLTFKGVGYGDSKNWISILYHIIIFFFLSIFLFISLIKGENNIRKFEFAILILIAYGILDEIHQFFVPGRFCSLVDVGFDGTGILFAFLVYIISLEYREIL